MCWRESVDDPIRVYRMTRVTYGVTSSAYHAIRTLQDAAEFCQSDDAKRAILEDFYVDDLLGGADKQQDTIDLRLDMAQALAKR